jgi:predicted AlkP superfamily phosphohydrolase/phosphomutase
MFWRFRDRSHPANRDGFSEDFVPVIAEHYRACDAIVGRALEHSDDSTLFLALSDHGFNSFQRGVNLNTWLCDNGLMVLKEGLTPGEEAGDMFRAVDWPRTKAYAVGLSGLYVNMKGREAQGVVPLEDAADLQARIAQALTGLVDAERGQVAIQNAVPSHRLYSGACANESPDVVVNCSSGYRVSWGTALGGMPEGLFEDNPKKWSGDHIIDPDLVPGVLFINRPFDTCGPRLVDMAPTILAALGVPAAATMEGKSLLR